MVSHGGFRPTSSPTFLAHLSCSDKVSFCDRSLSVGVVCCRPSSVNNCLK